MIKESAPQTDVLETAAVKATVEQIRGSLDGELISRPVAIDHLLDLRSVVRGRPTLVAKVDAVLSDVPGQRTVATAWLGVVLTDLERLASLTQTEQNWSPSPPEHRASSL